MTERRRVSFGIKFWFGVGQGAEGIKNAALASLLLFYYSQVLGLDPALTGFALLLGILTDGISDALVGSLSDSLRHRWGRRHPFMYAAAIPFGISFAALFLPPAGLGQWGLFAWLTVTVILARNMMTLYVIPHYALGAELSPDHEERTTIVAYRAFFGYLGSASIFFAATFLFRSSADYPVGQLDPAPYGTIGLLFGAVMALLILGSALGTHAAIPTLPQPTGPAERFSFLRMFREVKQITANRTFRFYLAGFFCWVIALTIARTFEIYLGTYFWKLTKNQVFLLPAISLAAMLVSTFFWSWISRSIGKKHVLIYSVAAYCIIFALLIGAKLAGLLPAEGTEAYVGVIFVASFCAAFAGGSPPVIAGSMLADIADESELETGRRQEGMFFGAINVIVKVSGAIGAQLSGIILAVIGLKKQAAPSDVPVEVSHALGGFFGLALVVLGFLAILFYRTYSLDKARHADIRRALDDRASQAVLGE